MVVNVAYCPICMSVRRRDTPDTNVWHHLREEFPTGRCLKSSPKPSHIKRHLDVYLGSSIIKCQELDVRVDLLTSLGTLTSIDQYAGFQNRERL